MFTVMIPRRPLGVMLGSIREMFQDLNVSSAVSTFTVWQRHKSPALKKRKVWIKTGAGGFPLLIHGFLWGTVCPFHIVDVSPPCPFSPFSPSFFFKLSAFFFFFLERWFQGYTSTAFWHLVSEDRLHLYRKKK